MSIFLPTRSGTFEGTLDTNFLSLFILVNSPVYICSFIGFDSHKWSLIFKSSYLFAISEPKCLERFSLAESKALQTES
jgi:hypothetical protein